MEAPDANCTPAKPSREIAAILQSRDYHDYQRAFTRGTGLPLRLHAPEILFIARYPRGQESPFGAMMALTNRHCALSDARCCESQRLLEKRSQLGPHTLRLFTGLCETAVPVRVGDKLIGFLQTGQVLLNRPDKASFERIKRTLLSWGAQVNFVKLEASYFRTRVLAPVQYEALVRLLAIFAEQLAAVANALSLQSEQAEPLAMTRARTFIGSHAHDDLSLAQVAGVANMSANYFSEKFKETTGINFVEYVARVRVEEARSLLHDPRRRITEVAFEVGFQSLSQFNRSFREFCGESPTDYRTKFTVGAAESA